jgi:hypothetical protein
MEAKLVQRDEGREEARIVIRTQGQDPSKCRKAGGDSGVKLFLFCACIQKTLRDYGKDERSGDP